MPQPASSNPNVVPTWVVIVGSTVIAAHLVAVAALVLAAPSGPWLTPFGPSDAIAPKFAQLVNDVSAPHYLRHIKLVHNYHFASNGMAPTGVKFKAILKDKDGKAIETLEFPDSNASPWVQHRQSLLAQKLGIDLPVQPPGGERVPAPGQQTKAVKIWKSTDGGQTSKLEDTQEHLVPRFPPTDRPSEWSLLLARAYARHLCRQHGAASAELIRYAEPPVNPVVLLISAEAAEGPNFKIFTRVANFGEFPRE